MDIGQLCKKDDSVVVPKTHRRISSFARPTFRNDDRLPWWSVKPKASGAALKTLS
jgi:hypothetical protein